MLRHLKSPIVILAFVSLSSSASANIFAEDAKPFVAPNRMFAVNVPPSWAVKQGNTEVAALL